MKKKNPVKSNFSLLLPKSVVIIIESLKLSPTNRNMAYNILRIILRQAKMQGGLITDVREFPASYFKKAVGAHYERALKPLLDEEVILKVKSYSTETSTCNSYQLNPRILSMDFVKVEFKVDYSNIEMEQISKVEKSINELKPNTPKIIKYTLKTLNKLKIDIDLAEDRLKSYLLNDEFMKTIKIDPDLPPNKPIPLKNYGKFRLKDEYISVEVAKKIANQKNNLRLIQDKQSFSIEEPVYYTTIKMFTIALVYYNHLIRIQEKHYFATRNVSNFRLDTNITSLPEIFMDFLKIGNQPLVSFDLKNSQFAILASLIVDQTFSAYLPDSATAPILEFVYPFIHTNIIPHIQSTNEPVVSTKSVIPTNKPNSDLIVQFIFNLLDKMSTNQINVYTYMCAKRGKMRPKNDHKTTVFQGDIAQFIKVARNGKLYEFVQKELDLPKGSSGRKMAKIMLFEIFFSSHKNRSQMKKELIKILPTFVEMIDGYKKNKGDGQFSIFLQQRESEIFIDRILMTVMKQKLDVLTKHDSVLCPLDQKDAVLKIIKEILDEELGEGEYKLKISEYGNLDN